jgi:HAD superfamily hydrolase (TIGR01509 family)
MVRAVLFDVFGTVIDAPADVYLAPYSHLIAPLNLTEKERLQAVHLLLTAKHTTLDEAADALESMFPGHVIPTANRQSAFSELEEHVRCLDLVNGTATLLPQLTDAGIKLALVSNLAEPYARAIRQHRLDDLVDVTVYSYGVGFAKPEPEIFEIALERLNVKAEDAVMIGDDSTNDVEGARSVGITAFLVEAGGEDDGASLKRVVCGLF